MEDNSLFEFSVKGLFGVHDYDIKFPKDRRVTFLTGPNGYGKTTILDAIWGISARWPGRLPPVFDTLHYQDSDNDLVVSKGINALSFNGQTESEWEAGSVPATAFRIKCLSCNVDYYSMFEELESFRDTIGEDLAGRANAKRGELFRKLLDKYLHGKKWLDDVDHFCNPDFELESGHRIDVHELSAGEKLILLVWYYVLFGQGTGNLYIIDTPETCMHVAWQFEFKKDLADCMELVDGHAFVATHSPSIINSCWSEVIDLYELEHQQEE